MFIDLDGSEDDDQVEDAAPDPISDAATSPGLTVNDDQNPDTAAASAITFQTAALDPALESFVIDPDLEKLCTTCVASKSTQTVKRHKSMTPTNKKLE